MTSRIDLKRAFLAASTAVAVAFALVLVAGGSAASADGDGSPAVCKTGLQASGTQDEMTFTASAGKIVDGVCIKSGQLHTGVLSDGLYENGCYEVSGVGTQTVTVKRVGDPGPDCQEISHVDVLVTDEPPAEPGNIIVKKEVTQGSATDKSFVFTASYDGDGFSLSHGQSNDSGDLTAGTYSVSETVPTGWQLKSKTCSDGSDPSSISLQESETVTCTFVNHVPVEVSPTSIVSTTTTIPDVVSPTSIVSTTVEVSVETLPFTGFESGTAGLLALALVASGALALVGTRVFRGETDE